MEVKEEKKNNKKNLLLLIIGGIVFLILVGVIIWLLFANRSVKLTFDLGNGKKQVIEVKDGEKFKLPEEPTKEGHVFSGWVNKAGNYIINTGELDDDDEFEPVFIPIEQKIYTLTFKSDDEVLGVIKLAEKETIVLPIHPQKEGYVFMGWINEDDNLIEEYTIVHKDSTYKAYWVKESEKVVEVTIDLDNGYKSFKVKMVNGKLVMLPSVPEKDGKVFDKWVDQDGNDVTDQTVISDKTKLKAIWKDPYICPKDCNPNEGGATCNKVVTTDTAQVQKCPSGTTSYYGRCIDLSKKESANIRQCNDWDWGDEVYYENWCVKKVSPITVTECPEGYSLEDNTCKKTETLECTKN